MKQFWDERYANEEYAYGEEANRFLKEQLEKLPVGNILFPAEGEGRNAVYAATLGWSVSAFDISVEGKKKALQLADKNKVELDYRIGEFKDLEFKAEYFDVLALIFAHFPANIKSSYHKTLANYLRKGGIVIFEAFSKKNLEYLSESNPVGGPRDVDMLFSVEEIKADFPGFEILELEEKEIELSEGLFHNGQGSVIRFVGRKK